MGTVRTLAVAGVILIGVLAVPAPAQAHGALESPVSRTVACSDEGTAGGTVACRAARAASAPGAASDWDNLRVPGVNGRDRSVIPDGKLCSGGLTEFAGLDLPRTDWPTTRLTAGTAFTFRYRTTIPHAGTFRLYLTNATYRPGTTLRWSALDTKPFLTVADPAVTGGNYLLRGRLPAGRTGRAVIYTIWRTTSTPDTYYSCSDVTLNAPRAAAGAPGATRRDVPTPSATAPSATAAAATAPSATAAAKAAADGSPAVTPSPSDLAASPAAAQRSTRSTRTLITLATGTAVVALGIGGIVALVVIRRARRHERHHS